MKALVTHIQGIPIPSHHAAKAVQQPTKLDPDTPATFVFAFFPNLLWAAAFPDGKNQLNRITVNDAKES